MDYWAYTVGFLILVYEVITEILWLKQIPEEGGYYFNGQHQEEPLASIPSVLISREHIYGA